MSRLLRRYSAFAEKRPLLSAFSTTGVIFAAGDLLSQSLVERRPDRDETNSRKLFVPLLVSARLAGVRKTAPPQHADHDAAPAPRHHDLHVVVERHDLACRSAQGSSDSATPERTCSEPRPQSEHPSTTPFAVINTDIDRIRVFTVWLYCTVLLGPGLGLWYTRMLPWLVSNASSFRHRVAMMVCWDQLLESSATDASFLYCIRFLDRCWEAYFGGAPETTPGSRAGAWTHSPPRRPRSENGGEDHSHSEDDGTDFGGVSDSSGRSVSGFGGVSESGVGAVLAGIPETHNNAWQHLKTHFAEVYMTDCLIWPLIQTINFSYVPAHLQTPVVSLVSVFWAAYLSFKNQQKATVGE